MLPAERNDFARIVELRESLPRPVHTEKIAGGNFSLYRAKELFVPEWGNFAAQALVTEARKSYQLYGDIPLLDRFDQKAAVYLTQVTFQDDKERPANEWFTVRFVPGEGEPYSSEDLEFYSFSEEGNMHSVKKAMVERLPQVAGFSEEDLLSKTAAVSRLGAVRGYYDNGDEMESAGRGSKYVGISFALMNMQFLKDARHFMDVRLMTSQIHDSLRRVLSYPPLSGKYSMPFTPGYNMLRVEPEAIRVDRTNPDVYAKDFPSYFYDLGSLGAAFRNFIRDGSLSYEDALRYIPQQVLDRDVKRPAINLFRNAGKLLGQLSNEQLDVIDKTVPDATELCIMDAGDWKRGAEQMITAAKTGQTAAA
ncbi:MAG: hypothetical protein ACM3IJ_00735 [Candidatus Levyibacteriota bacterium]